MLHSINQIYRVKGPRKERKLHNEKISSPFAPLFTVLALTILPGLADTEQTVNDQYPATRELTAAIDDYFHYRELSFVDRQLYNTEDIRVSQIRLQHEVKTDEETRTRHIRDTFSQTDIQVLDADVSATVKSVSEKDTSTLTAEVYEWTWVYYLMEESTEIEEMGFGTNHTLLIDKAQNTVIKDYYDEELLFGAYTVPEDQLTRTRQQAIEQSAAAYLPDNAASPSPGTSVVPMAASVSNAGYFPARGVEYADTYVIKKKTDGQYEEYYNDFFCYFGNDCVNYVSQCLKMGGLAEDYDTGKSNTSGSQWWIDMGLGLSPRYNNYTVSPLPARSITYFRSYFKSSRRGCTEKTVPSSNPASVVFPGNPVYTTAHMTICTGYNSAGMPILNGHTYDWYHVPLSFFSGTKYTMQIATRDTFNHGANDNYCYSIQNVNNYPTAITTPVFTLGQKDVKFIWFSLSTAKSLNIQINTSLDVTAKLYLNEKVVDGDTLYLYLLKNLNGRGASNVQSLSAGKYYISVRPYQASTSGSFSITFTPS